MCVATCARSLGVSMCDQMRWQPGRQLCLLRTLGARVSSCIRGRGRSLRATLGWGSALCDVLEARKEPRGQL